MDRKKKHDKLNNNGSTLITVIVSISFITILAAIILGTVTITIRMKAIDRRAKDEFYYAEKALNDIYTVIGQNAAEKAAKAYDAAFTKVGRTVNYKDALDNDKSITIETEEDAKKYYKISFCKAMKKVLNDNKDDFSSFIVPVTGESYTANSVKNVKIEKSDGVSAGDSYEDAQYIKLPDVTVIATDDQTGIRSVVVTDIVIYIPDLGFMEKNSDIINYAIISNKGMKIDGDLTVNGNVYSGVHSQASDSTKIDSTSSGIVINKGICKLDGEYIVSKGDIKVGSSGETATLVVGKSGETLTNLWYDSLETVKGSTNPKIDIEGNVYALNDLELNADNSDVSISKGAYYGYDDEKSFSNPSLSGESKHSNSSAVLINGNHSSLKMQELTTFVLMGKAYFQPKGSSNEVATAESVALKTNQQLYMVPNDFMTCPNPSTSEITSSHITIPDDWFGREYLAVKADGSYDYDIANVTDGATTYYIAYLKFKEGNTDENKYVSVLSASNQETPNIVNKTVADADSTKNYSNVFSARTAYVKKVMYGEPGGGSPNAQQLKKRIELSITNATSGAFSLQRCIILQDDAHNSDDYNVYSENAVVSYYPDGSDFAIKSVSNTAAMDRFGQYPQNLYRRYQWFCAQLDAKDTIPISQEISTKPEDSVVDWEGNGFEWKIDSKFPLNEYIKLSWSGSDELKDPKTATDMIQIYDDGVELTGTISGLIICKGDAKVKNATINGTLVSFGVLVFEGNNTIKSDYIALQKRIEDEIELVKEDGVYRKNYIISYLIDKDTHDRLFKYDRIDDDKIKYQINQSIKYTDFVFIENWQKGGRG